MDRQYTVDEHPGANKSANGPNSRSSDLYEKKKYNKDEDNYFKGTGVQKTKKSRKPRMPESSLVIQAGFTEGNRFSAPPPVNAWTQKKGSALFREDHEVDEEDEMLKLALQESLRTAKEDKERQLAKLRVENVDVPCCTQTTHPEEDWEESGVANDVPRSKENRPKPDLHFIDSDSEEIAVPNQRRKPLPQRNKRPSLEEKPSTALFVHKNFYSSEEQNELPISPDINDPHYKNTAESNNHFKNNSNYVNEPLQPQKKYSKPLKNNTSGPSSSHSQEISKPPEKTRPVVVDESVPSMNDLSTNLESTLRFGDTQECFEMIENDYIYKSDGEAQSSKSESPTLNFTETDNTPVQANNATFRGHTSCSESSETDIMLHNFIRHEPPSIITNPTEPMPINGVHSNYLVSTQSPQSYVSQDLNHSRPNIPFEMAQSEQRRLLNGASVGNMQVNDFSISQDSGSSLSGSPQQNVSPYGSIESKIHPTLGTGTGLQMPSQIGSLPYQYPVRLPNIHDGVNPNLQAIQLANQNLPPQIRMEYSSIPVPLRGMVALNSQMGMPQYRLPNHNFMLPSYQGQGIQNLPPHIYQAHLQPLIAANALRPNQQPQIVTNIGEAGENLHKDQIGTVDPSQILGHQSIVTQNQAQILMQNQQAMPPHNQPQLFPAHHPQLISMMETSVPKQDPQKNSPLNMGTVPNLGRTQEELLIEYQKTLQTLSKIQQEMQEAQVQSNSSIPVPQHLQFMVPPNHMGIGMNHFFPGVSAVQPQFSQLSPNTEQLSPNLQQAYPNMSETMNIGTELIQNLELNNPQEMNNSLIEPKTGRGRGRIQQ